MYSNLQEKKGKYQVPEVKKEVKTEQKPWLP